MKHFVYLDTDALNSYISQINDGLLKNTVNETFDEISTTKIEGNVPGKSGFNSEFGFKPFFNLKFSEDKDVINTTNTLSQIESGRELIEKIIHDNAFEQFRKHLQKEFTVNNVEDCQLGDYIELSEKYIVRDLDYILTIYTEEFIDFMCDNLIREHEAKRPINANTSVIKAFDKKIEEIRNRIKIEQNNVKRIFSISKNIMPFSKFLLCNGCIIPLNDKFLRETTQKIRFSYSEKIKILGRYTSTLEEAVKREEKIQNSFDDLYSSLDETFKELYINVLGIDQKAKIIQPIALYFE